MSDPEYDLYLDKTDDLVQAYLEQEHVRPLETDKIDKEVHGGSRKGEKRGRERSGSVTPPRSSFGPRLSEGERRGKKNRGSGWGCRDSCEKTGSNSQGTETNTKTKTETSSAIIITEPPAAWPPSNMTASESIKRAHSDHRKYLLSLPSSSSASTSTSTSSSTMELKPRLSSTREMITIHPSLTSSSQSTLKLVADQDPSLHTFKPTHPKPKFKTENPLEALNLTPGKIRDERGNLTVKGKRALDERLLGGLGTEGNAITNSDLYSRWVLEFPLRALFSCMRRADDDDDDDVQDDTLHLLGNGASGVQQGGSKVQHLDGRLLQG
jgi:hypothetical protein